METYQARHADIDSVIEPLLVMIGDRSKVEFKDFNKIYYPAKGDKDLEDLEKIFFDDESWHHGHGHAYETYGIRPRRGCIVIVRPDQCVSLAENVAWIQTNIR